MKKENIVRCVIYLLGAVAAALGILFGISSCSFSRGYIVDSVSNCSRDSVCVIHTDVRELYDFIEHK